MAETTSFFGSKMIDVEDSLVIDNSNIVYYQNQNAEQMNLTLEKNNTPILYNMVQDKINNHTLQLDDSQNLTQSEINTRWVIRIEMKNILSNFLFATLKKARTFEGIKNTSTINGSVDDAIRDYIYANIINRYEFSGMDFYVEYVELSTQGRLKFSNNFRDINTGSNITTRIQSVTNFDKSRLEIKFDQQLPSSTHCFDYYFVLKYNKI
jgi:hypothetical protein